MNVFLITYDLYDPTKSEALLTYLKSGGDWAKVAESSYAIETSTSLEDVMRAILRITNGAIRVYGFEISASYWAGRGPQEVNEWLHATLIE